MCARRGQQQPSRQRRHRQVSGLARQKKRGQQEEDEEEAMTKPEHAYGAEPLCAWPLPLINCCQGPRRLTLAERTLL